MKAIDVFVEEVKDWSVHNWDKFNVGEQKVQTWFEGCDQN
jgi:hypothetical protein